MDISIVNISKGPHELNKDILKELDAKKISFNISSRLRYSSKSDYVGFQIDLMIMQEKTQVFKSGFLVGLSVADWAKDLQTGLDLNTNREKLYDICKVVWFVATGIVAEQSSDGDFNGIILPSVDYEAFSKDVILIPNADQ